MFVLSFFHSFSACSLSLTTLLTSPLLFGFLLELGIVFMGTCPTWALKPGSTLTHLQGKLSNQDPGYLASNSSMARFAAAVVVQRSRLSPACTCHDSAICGRFSNRHGIAFRATGLNSKANDP